MRITSDGGHKLSAGYPEGRRMWLTMRSVNDLGLLLGAWGPVN